jgi:hypothetical protein
MLIVSLFLYYLINLLKCGKITTYDPLVKFINAKDAREFKFFFALENSLLDDDYI